MPENEDDNPSIVRRIIRAGQSFIQWVYYGG